MFRVSDRELDVTPLEEGTVALTMKQADKLGLKKGDTVFMYVGAPVSAILYKCLVTETGIPYRKKNEHITIRELMRIRLQKRYSPDRFPFSVLKEEFDVRAVRGPRGIPDALSEALKKTGSRA